MTRFLQALFPSSKQIMIVRHPIVVALSTVKWAGPRTSLSHLVEHWLIAHETLLADASHVYDLHVLKYEDLVEQPERTLADLGSYLDLSGPIPADSLQQGRSSSYHSQWRLLSQSRHPWKQHAVKALRSRFQARVSQFGYDLYDLDAAQPFPKSTPAPGDGAALS